MTLSTFRWRFVDRMSTSIVWPITALHPRLLPFGSFGGLFWLRATGKYVSRAEAPTIGIAVNRRIAYHAVDPKPRRNPWSPNRHFLLDFLRICQGTDSLFDDLPYLSHREIDFSHPFLMTFCFEELFWGNSHATYMHDTL